MEVWPNAAKTSVPNRPIKMLSTQKMPMLSKFIKDDRPGEEQNGAVDISFVEFNH